MSHHEITQNLRNPINQVLSSQNLEVDHVLCLPRFKDAASLREFLLETCEELLNSQGTGPESLMLISTRKIEVSTTQSNPKTLRTEQKLDPATQETATAIRDNEGSLNLPFLIQNAEVLLNAGENELARRILQKIQRKPEAAAIAHRLLARSYQSDNDLPKAIHHLRESLVFESSVESLERLAALLIRQGNDSAALEYLQRLLGTDSLPLHKRLDVLLTCGNACARAENLDSAFAYYQQGLELTGERDLRFLNNKGALYLRQARLEAAIDTFHSSLDLNETQPNTHYGLGSAYLAGGNLKLALEHFAESLEIKIDQPHVLYQLIRCSHQLNSHTTAARILADYIDEVTSSPSLNYTLAGLQFTLGRNNECAMTLAKILMVNPNHTHALELRERNRKISAEKKVSL